MFLKTLGKPPITLCFYIFAHCTRRIMSGTIKDNILFSHQYDDTFYNLVLDGEGSNPSNLCRDSHRIYSLRTQARLGPSF